ncbi:TfuA-like protein [Streptomyces sp. BF23-19]|uniref:TfuA-like protein n=1 Tax=unclassified Streptomyces TaxID=2593676 RepID=UPI0034E4FC02
MNKSDPNKPDLAIFVGPSAHGIDPSFFSGLTVLPPVRRGDIQSLVDATDRPGQVAIVDGTFHSYPSVGHAEIRTALAAGWVVWGLSSMGALRAAEMHSMGMRGFGEVFQQYVMNPDLDDDEVALLHGSEQPHPPLSEPLIHIREFLARLQKRDVIGPDEADHIIHTLKYRWYGERTLPLLRDSLVEHGGLSMSAATAEVLDFGDSRLKTLDLIRFIEEKPWR